jgi:hypothetical protein
LSRDGVENIGAQLNWVNFATPKFEIPRDKDELTRKYVKHVLDKLEAKTKEITDAADAKRMREIAESLQGLGLSDDVIARVLAPRGSLYDDLYGPTSELQSYLRATAPTAGKGIPRD